MKHSTQKYHNLLISNHQINLFQYGQEPININLAQYQTLNSIIKLVSQKQCFKKIRLFDQRCQEIFEEDLKYLKQLSKIYVTTNGKPLDSRFILYEFNPQSIISRGGQASVMLISHKITQEVRALKFIGEGQRYSYLYIAREAVILDQLKHINIVKMFSYNLFPQKSEVIIQLEYLKGGSLFDYINEKGPFSELTARKVFIQILDALKYCHKNNVIHRDLKLENILISDPNELNIKIIDFGLAYLTGTGVKFDEPINVGTILYAAPEIIFGKLKTVNFSVDVWALGVILYYLVFGKYPFDGVEKSDILIKISECNYTIPSKVSWELVELINEIFNPNYEQRITLQEISNHNWTRGITQGNHMLSIPISDLPTTSKNQFTQENSVRKTKEDLLTLIERKEQSVSQFQMENFIKKISQYDKIKGIEP